MSDKTKPWTKAVVYVIDDDESLRKAIGRLLESAGLVYDLFDSAETFMSSCLRQADVSCAVVDIRMGKGLTGIELQKVMQESKMNIPIIFITGHGDVQTSVKALKSGALHFITKPFENEELMEAIDDALLYDYKNKKAIALREKAITGYENLTKRERQVFTRVARGFINKKIAEDLQISEKTVKIHRAHMIDKMRANSTAELVRMAYALAEVKILTVEDIELDTKD